MDLRIVTFLLYGAAVEGELYDYEFINTPMNWTDAQSFCRQHYLDLASFRNTQDESRAASVVFGEAWIGLYDDPASWKSGMTEDPNSWQWVGTPKPSEGGFQKWKSGQPDNLGGNQECVVMTGGEWDDYNCSATFGFACHPVAGVKIFNHITEEKMWYSAAAHCLGENRLLAMIENEGENTVVANFNPNGYTWIGLNRRSWRWSSGTPSQFRHWDDGFPANINQDSHCASVNTELTWRDGACSSLKPFICQREILKMRIRRTVLSLSSEADLSDPQLRSQVITEVGAELERRDFSDFKVKWLRSPVPLSPDQEKTSETCPKNLT